MSLERVDRRLVPPARLRDFAISRPWVIDLRCIPSPAFALDRRVLSIAERLQGSVGRTRRRINGSVARLGLAFNTNDVTDLQPGRSETGRMVPASEPERG